jgi:hypothetical protein
VEIPQPAKVALTRSPIGALVFFIKKKDGGLRFIQDYHTLDEITKMATLFRSLMISFTDSTECTISQNWMSTGVTTMSALKKVTSGKRLFGPTTDFSNHWYCTLDLQTAPQLPNHDE